EHSGRGLRPAIPAGSGAAVRGAGVRRLGPEPSRLGGSRPARQAPQRDGHRRAGVRHPGVAPLLAPGGGAPAGRRGDHLRRRRPRPGQADGGNEQRRRNDRARAWCPDPRRQPDHQRAVLPGPRDVPQLRRRGIDPAVPAVPVERGQRAEPGGGAAGRRPVRAAVRPAAARRRDPARRARGRL
ncbi:MAG: hypothetical protein AVDCRST_MAG54-4775, partial [uncultured Actinomycetospora sp.]